MVEIGIFTGFRVLFDFKFCKMKPV